MVPKVIGWFLLLGSVFSCSAQQASPAAQRAGHLRRGINTSMWFAQSPGNYTVDRLEHFTTPADLHLIRELGFDHIRLSIDPEPLVPWVRQPGDNSFLKELDKVVAEATANGLAVIVDIHPESRYKQQLFTGNDGVSRFTELWGRLAGHFRNTDPQLVFFEIMNEPEQSDDFRWLGIENVVAQAIRAAAPQHTIIAGGAHWSGVEDLLRFEPLSLGNVIYTFHDYEPFAFTHQGATWTDPRVVPLREVPYPSTPENVVRNQEQESTLDGKWFVEQYGLDRWDAERVDRSVAFAEQWSRLHGVPIYCGEFGVHAPYAPAADRAHWTHDMRVALEKHGIGWAMWDYQTNFGLVSKANGQTTPDPAIVDALGLRSH